MGRQDRTLSGLRISYRTEVSSSTQQDVTRAYAVDVYYRNYSVSISTRVDEDSTDSFVASINGMVLVDPIRKPLLNEDFVVKQMSNFLIAVTSPTDFRLEFDVLNRIYVHLEPQYENKVTQCFHICCCCCCCCCCQLATGLIQTFCGEDFRQTTPYFDRQLHLLLLS